MYEYNIHLNVSKTVMKEYLPTALKSEMAHNCMGAMFGILSGRPAYDVFEELIAHGVRTLFNETPETISYGYTNDGKMVQLIGSEEEVTDINLELGYVTDSPSPIVLYCNGVKIFRCNLSSSDNKELLAYINDDWMIVSDLPGSELKSLFYKAVSYAMANAPKKEIPEYLAPKKELPLHGTDEEHVIHPPVPKAPGKATPEAKEVPAGIVDKSEVYKVAMDAVHGLDMGQVYSLVSYSGMIDAADWEKCDLLYHITATAFTAIDEWYAGGRGEGKYTLHLSDKFPDVFIMTVNEECGLVSIQIDFTPYTSSKKVFMGKV